MRRRLTYANVASTLALISAVIAMSIGGAVASGVLVTSKQIKNGTILTQDIRKGAVKSSDIGTNAVRSGDVQDDAIQSADIGAGEVQPENLSLPAPAQLQDNSPDTVQAPRSFVLANVAGTYSKVDPSSLLEVTWTGTAAAGFSPCIFQLRIDGQPAGANAGETYVANSSTISVSVSALFSGLAPGPHSIEVWASSTQDGSFPCTVGPAHAGIGQTFVVAEQIV